MGQDKKPVRRKKRYFHGKTSLAKRQIQDGGAHESNPDMQEIRENELDTSASASKIAGNLSSDDEEDIMPGFILMDIGILSEFLDQNLPCPNCHIIGKLHASINVETAQGFAYQVECYCSSCGIDSPLFTTSKRCEKSDIMTGKKLPMEVNIRAVSFVRAIGKGHATLVHFAKHMNSPPPMSKSSYDNLMSLKHSAASSVAKSSMKNAAEEVKNKVGNDIAVSVDGSWQRRGHASNNGLVTVLSVDTGKCLDVEVLSKICKGCEKWKGKADTPEYALWKVEHDNCRINHTGSAGAMEPVGAVRIFNRSVEEYDLKYVKYLGDGDSSSYKNVVESKPYECAIEKLECVGHVQKRVGSRLRKLKQKNKGIGGAGKLTESKIDTLQNYFGLAIRQNVNDILTMQQNTQATLYHVASTDENPNHTQCPVDSWCEWNNNPDTYKHKHGLPDHIVTLIEPIYEDLCDEALLRKCLHGKTQNANECLNKIIWDHCAKTTFVGRETLEEGVYSSVALFNDGNSSIVDQFTLLGVTNNDFTKSGCRSADKQRLQLAGLQSSEKAKKDRKIRRAIKKRFIDAKTLQEGNVYEKGAH